MLMGENTKLNGSLNGLMEQNSRLQLQINDLQKDNDLARDKLLKNSTPIIDPNLLKELE